MRVPRICVSIFLSCFFLFGGTVFAFPISVRNHNFGVVEEGVLYRSAQPGEKFLERVIKERGIKTIVVLRGGVLEHEREISEKHGITIHHLPMTVSAFPSEKTVEAFLAIMDDPKNHPVLVHCKHGADRAGLMVALYRLEIQKRELCPDIPREMRFYRNLRFIVPMPKLFLKSHYDAPCVKPFKQKKIDQFIK